MTGNARIDIREAGTGWEVVRLEPVVLASFTRKDHAAIFVGALAGEGAVPEVAVVADPPSGAPVTFVGSTRAEQVAVEPESKRAAPPAPEPAPDPAAAPVPAAPEPDPGVWEAALDRVEAGEKLKTVAADMELPFNALRGRWANAIMTGARQKPVAVAAPARPASDADEDTPVSGGPGAVLERGKPREWSDDQDAALLAAEPAAVYDLARTWGLPPAIVERRKAALEARAARLMQEG